jgi:hypothetical protein
VRLLFDSRSNPEFKWISKDNLSFDQRRWSTWPVFSMEGIAKAVRHTNFAPGDLDFDPRGGGCVRQLPGVEKWNLMGLSKSKADFLSSQGLSSQLGPLAGNSIPARMTEAVAEDVAVRVAKYEGLLKQRNLGGYVLMPPVAGLQDPSLTATFLNFVGLVDSTVLVWNGCELPGMVSTYDQSGAFNAAKSWAASLGCTGTERCILLEALSGKWATAKHAQ